MTQTEHYQLNQWSASDRVHHDDFNEDNLKIDAALAGKLEQIEILDEQQSDSYQMHAFAVFPEQGREDSANKWAVTGILFNAGSLEGTNPKVRLYINAADRTQKEIGISTTTPVMVVFFPCHDENRMISGIMFGSSTIPFLLDIPYKDNQFGAISGVDNTLVKNSLIRHFAIR